MKNFVITFDNSHQAIKANIRLNNTAEIIPTPREISSECGFSLLAKACDLKKLKQEIAESNLKYSKIYQVEDVEGEKVYEEIS